MEVELILVLEESWMADLMMILSGSEIKKLDIESLKISY